MHMHACIYHTARPRGQSIQKLSLKFKSNSIFCTTQLDHADNAFRISVRATRLCWQVYILLPVFYLYFTTCFYLYFTTCFNLYFTTCFLLVFYYLFFTCILLPVFCLYFTTCFLLVFYFLFFTCIYYLFLLVFYYLFLLPLAFHPSIQSMSDRTLCVCVCVCTVCVCVCVCTVHTHTHTHTHIS